MIPHVCVRSTMLEVQKLLCVTRSFEGIVWLVGSSGRLGGSQLDCGSRQRTRSGEADGGVELAVRRAFPQLILAVLCRFFLRSESVIQHAEGTPG